jgi:hypothetical protein
MNHSENYGIIFTNEQYFTKWQIIYCQEILKENSKPLNY